MMRNLSDALVESLHVSHLAETGGNGRSRNPVESPMGGFSGRSSATPRTFWAHAWLLAPLLLTLCAKAAAEPLECDFTNYRAGRGLRAAALEGDVLLEWGSDPVMTMQGTFGPAPVGDVESRAIIGVERGQPMVRMLATTSKAGDWVTLAHDARLIAHVAEINEAGERELLQRRAGTTHGSGEPNTACRLSDRPLRFLRDTANARHRRPQPGTEPRPGAIRCEVRRVGQDLELSINVSSAAGHERTLWLTVRSNSRVLRHEEVLAHLESPARPGSSPGRKAVVAGLGDMRASGYTELIWLGGDGDICRHPYAGPPASMSDTPTTLRAAEPVLVLGRRPGSLAVLSPSPLALGAEPGEVWHWQGRDGRLALGTWREVPQPGQDEIVSAGGSPSGADSSGKPLSDSAALRLPLVVDYYLSAEGPTGTLFEALD